MSEVAEAPVQVSAEPQQTQELSNTPVDPFGNGAWQETLPEVKQTEPVKTEIITPTNTQTPSTNETEEILDPTDWLKREFGVDSPEVLKQQIKEYGELKSKPPTELS